MKMTLRACFVSPSYQPTLAQRLLTQFSGLVGLAVLGLAACGTPPDARVDGTDVNLVLLHSSDIHARLLPYTMDVALTDTNLGLKQENAPFGGIARLASVVKQTRRDSGRFLYVDTGDVFQGAPIFNEYGGKVEFRAMNQLGVDAFAVGNHEFDQGTNFFVKKALTYANFPLLAANYLIGDPNFPSYVASGKVVEPFKIINVDGLRVGIIGIGYAGGSPLKAMGSQGVVELRNRQVVQSYVDFLRPIVDLVVVLSHAGYQADIELVPRIEGVDVIFGGHLHIALQEPAVVQDCDIIKLNRERDRYSCTAPEKLAAAERACQRSCENKTGAEATTCAAECLSIVKQACERESAEQHYDRRLVELDGDLADLRRRRCTPRDVLVVHSGAFLKYVGRLELTLRQCHRLAEQMVCLERDVNGKCLQQANRRCVGGPGATNDWEIIARRYDLIPIDKRMPQESSMLALLQPYAVELAQKQGLTDLVGFTPRQLFRFSKSAGDSEVGNMLTQAIMQRPQVWAEFGVTNSLGIRADIPVGVVTAEQMTNVFPFDNSITIMYLTGRDVQSLMDFVADKSAIRGCQSQAQVAGITATLNCGGCKGFGDNRCAKLPYNGAPCAQRVTIGGSGRPCASDADCGPTQDGSASAEICTGQAHPDPRAIAAGKGKRCWRPLSCEATYRLATNDYIAGGGSGFTELGQNNTRENLPIPLRQAAKDYILSMPACGQIQKTYQERVDHDTSPVRYVVSADEIAQLTAWEDLATHGGSVEAVAGVGQLLARVATRRTEVAALLGKEQNVDARQHLAAERVALSNYLTCTKADRESAYDGSGCVGLTCWMLDQCDQHQDAKKDPDAMARCRGLAHVRAAMKCVTIPCISASEDGRLQRVFRDAAGPAHSDPDYPG